MPPRVSCHNSGYLGLTVLLLTIPLARPAEGESPAAVAAIQQLGARVRSMPGNRQELNVEFHLGGRDLTDQGLAQLVELKGIVALNLRDTQITSRGLSYLQGLTQLKWLHLERTQIGDAGMEHLSGLQKLQYLNLYGTQVTDKSLEHLRELKNLRRLYVWQTGVTDQGIMRLELALPQLKVVRGVDLHTIRTDSPSITETPATPIRWMPIRSAAQAPPSENGENTEIIFQNKSGRTVKIYWISYGNEQKLYGELAPGKIRRQNTYAHNSWLITDEQGEPLGYFIVGEASSLAVIPK